VIAAPYREVYRLRKAHAIHGNIGAGVPSSHYEEASPFELIGVRVIMGVIALACESARIGREKRLPVVPRSYDQVRGLISILVCLDDPVGIFSADGLDLLPKVNVF
jgi:hypothetical protein